MTVEHASTAGRHTADSNLGKNSTTWKRRTELQQSIEYEAQPQQQDHGKTQPTLLFTESVPGVIV